MRNLLLLIVLSLFPCAGFAQPSGEGAPSLRKRQHQITVSYESTRSKGKVEAGGTETKTDNSEGELEVEYGYNFGYFQLFAGAGSYLEEDHEESEKASTGEFQIGARANFIQNAPGNDLIPFVYLGLTGASGDVKTSTVSADITASATELGIGLDWYPLGEILAFRLVFASMTSKLKMKFQGTEVDGETRMGGLKVGTVFSF